MSFSPIGRSRAYDILHRAAVSLCIGVSFLGLVGLGFRVSAIMELKRIADKKKEMKQEELKDVATILGSSENVQQL